MMPLKHLLLFFGYSVSLNRFSPAWIAFRDVSFTFWTWTLTLILQIYNHCHFCWRAISFEFLICKRPFFQRLDVSHLCESLLQVPQLAVRWTCRQLWKTKTNTRPFVCLSRSVQNEKLTNKQLPNYWPVSGVTYEARRKHGSHSSQSRSRSGFRNYIR